MEKQFEACPHCGTCIQFKVIVAEEALVTLECADCEGQLNIVAEGGSLVVQEGRS